MNRNRKEKKVKSAKVGKPKVLGAGAIEDEFCVLSTGS